MDGLTRSSSARAPNHAARASVVLALLGVALPVVAYAAAHQLQKVSLVQATMASCGSVVLGGAAATSPLFLGAPLNANGKAFGSFGVVMTLVAYVFIMITMSMVCAVFSPVWAHWRQSENDRRKVQPRAITHGEPDVPVEPVEGVEGR